MRPWSSTAIRDGAAGPEAEQPQRRDQRGVGVLADEDVSCGAPWRPRASTSQPTAPQDRMPRRRQWP